MNEDSAFFYRIDFCPVKGYVKFVFRFHERVEPFFVRRVHESE